MEHAHMSMSPDDAFKNNEGIEVKNEGAVVHNETDNYKFDKNEWPVNALDSTLQEVIALVLGNILEPEDDFFKPSLSFPIMYGPDGDGRLCPPGEGPVIPTPDDIYLDLSVKGEMDVTLKFSLSAMVAEFEERMESDPETPLPSAALLAEHLRAMAARLDALKVKAP